MNTYEHYVDGKLNDRQQVVSATDGDADANGQAFDDHRIRGLIAQRREAGERDGWYEVGEWEKAEAEREHVSAGTIAQVLEAVGEDPQRAYGALLAERAQPKPRKTLVEQLEAIAAPVLAELHEKIHGDWPADGELTETEEE